MLTKKDYKKFAELFRVYLNRARNKDEATKVENQNGKPYLNVNPFEAMIVKMLKDYMQILKQDNPRFNRGKFWEAIRQN